jgi:hypothetical protein
MSKKRERTLAEAWAALNTQVSKGKPAPAVAGPFINANAIKLRPEVFQHRQPGDRASKAHVRELERGAAAESLEPVLVWWDGKAWACIDGHHRLMAYRAIGKHDALVNVEAFRGTPEEAMAEAARRNTRDKLTMSRTEKTGTAWRLVASTKLTKAETVEASGASDGTVAHMRRVRDKLQAAGEAAATMNWEAARRMAAGEALEASDWDDDRTEKEAQEIANKLVKALGQRASSRVEALARALEIFDHRLPDELRAHWGNLETSGEDDSEDS